MRVLASRLLRTQNEILLEVTEKIAVLTHGRCVVRGWKTDLAYLQTDGLIGGGASAVCVCMLGVGRECAQFNTVCTVVCGGDQI